MFFSQNPDVQYKRLERVHALCRCRALDHDEASSVPTLARLVISRKGKVPPMAQLGQTPGKTPLINVRAEHYFGIPEMAEQADVLEHIVIDMLVGVEVPKDEAERVLAAVTLHSGVQCTLENTDIRIYEDNNATEQPTKSE